MADTLKKLWVVIGAKVDGLQKGIYDVNQDIGNAEKDWKKSFANISAEMKKIGTVMLGVGGSITAGFALSIKEAEEDRVAVAGLSNTLANVGTNFANVKDRINEVIDASSAMTNYSKNEQTAALQKLIGFTGDYNTALSALPVVLDLAAYAHIDLEQSAKLVGDSMDGNSTRLKSMYGIDIPKTVDGLDALSAIEDKVKGSAVAVADPLTVMTNNFKEMAAQVGEVLLPVLKSIVDFIIPIIRQVQEWISQHEALTKVLIIGIAILGVVLTVLGGLLMILPTIISGVVAFGIAINVAMGPVGLITLAIIALIAAGVLIYENWSSISSFFSGLWNNIVSTFRYGINQILSFAENMANGFVTAVNTIISALNSIQVTIPSWVPGLGGRSFGVNIPFVWRVNIPRLAEGGNLVSGGSVMVGEEGPEVLNLPRGASVTPLNNRPIQVTIMLDSKILANGLVGPLADAIILQTGVRV